MRPVLSACILVAATFSFAQPVSEPSALLALGICYYDEGRYDHAKDVF